MATAIQDTFADEASHCYGCGRLNPDGLQLKSAPDGEGMRATFTPRPDQIGHPGYVYGGLLASLIDCHGVCTAIWATQTLEGTEEAPSFVTGTLNLRFVAPTPMGPELILRSSIAERSAKKVVVEVEVRAADTLTVRGQVIAVRLPATTST